MLALSWELTLFSLLVIPPAIWLSRRVAMLRRELTARTQRELADKRFRDFTEHGVHPGMVPPSGVFATANGVDVPALLPDGSVAPTSVSRTLQMRQHGVGRFEGQQLEAGHQAAHDAPDEAGAGTSGSAGSLGKEQA